MPNLVLGPLLRYVSTTEATVWVETDAPCEVTVLDRSATHLRGRRAPLRARRVRRPAARQHAALRGAPRRRARSGRGPTTPIRRASSAPTRDDESLRLAFGSCRVSVPHDEPYVLSKDDDPRGREVDALLALRRSACATRRRRSGPTRCCCSATRSTPTRSRPKTKEFIASRRARRRRPAARRGRRLRGVHVAVPRELERPGAALAAVDDLQRDDLRRPRRPRRLEHLRGVGRPDPRQAVVGGARPRGLHVVLDLPAPRQPLPRPPATTTRSSARCRSPRATAPSSCATSRATP